MRIAPAFTTVWLRLRRRPRRSPARAFCGSTKRCSIPGGIHSATATSTSGTCTNARGRRNNRGRTTQEGRPRNFWLCLGVKNDVRLCLLFLLLAFFFPAPSPCQTRGTEGVSSECKNRTLEKKLAPKGPYKFLPGETYKRSPTVIFQIDEDGTVSKVKLTRSSGVKAFDEQVVKTVSDWKFKGVPGCILDSEMTIVIDWE